MPVAADLPPIEQLTAQEPAPDRTPAELSAIMRYSMGLADAPRGSLTRTAQRSARSARNWACKSGANGRASSHRAEVDGRASSRGVPPGLGR